jgi:acyl-coenzyme A synthetase/AMP-(fatty) acid ligase
MYECEYSEHNDASSCVNIFRKEYFKSEAFLTGDAAFYDDDFDIKVSGRLDDVINISGHRLSTSEFECAIDKIDEVSENAVVAVPHAIKGQAAFVYVVLRQSTENLQSVVQKVIESIKKYIGPIAKPDFIAFTEALPKTRSGKIMRHVLRDIACDRTPKDLASIDNSDAVMDAQYAVKHAIECPDLCIVNENYNVYACKHRKTS